MRIDCSKTLNYAKEWERMCDYFYNRSMCTECPLYHTSNCRVAGKVTQEHINIVQKWSDEHPYETMAEHFFKMFPNASKTDSGMPVFCVKDLGWVDDCIADRASCRDCWNMPYIEK